MTFTDRIFLANYSLNAISAALPAGITSYLFVAFFGGVGGYAGVFIAQYTGRGYHSKVGRVLWQGIYFTLGSGICFWLLALFAAEPLFTFAGHPQDVQELERIYFTILCKGAVFSVATVTLSTFFTGRGLTRPVMLITFLGVIINIPLDYGLIFGRWGLPELGIRGAAIATVTAWVTEAACLSLLIFTKKNNHQFGVFSQYRFDRRLFARLMRFGVPGSLQFTIDILAFTLFILIIGRIGKLELAATNIVIIKGRVARRVPNPIPMRIEQKNSEKTTRIKDRAGPKPIGFPNWISPPASSLLNFGHPCVIIKAAIDTRNKRTRMFRYSSLVPV